MIYKIPLKISATVRDFLFDAVFLFVIVFEDVILERTPSGSKTFLTVNKD